MVSNVPDFQTSDHLIVGKPGVFISEVLLAVELVLYSLVNGTRKDKVRYTYEWVLIFM